MTVRRQRSLVVLSVLAMLGAAVPAAPLFADAVVFRTGERREGRIEPIEGDAQRVAFLNATGRIELDRSLIQEIEEHADAVDYTLIGDQHLKRGNSASALQMYQKALAADANHAAAREGMDKARARIDAEKAQAERNRQTDQSAKLDKAREALTGKKYPDAEGLIKEVLEGQPTAEQTAAAKLLQRDLYLAWAASRLDRLDPRGAEGYYRRVMELDPGNATAKEGLLRAMEGDPDPAKREEVLAVYKERLAKTPADVELNRKVADLLLSMNRGDEAIEPMLALKDWSNFRTLKYDQRLKAAVENASRTRATAGDLDGAISLYEKYLAAVPEGDPSPLTYLRYERRLQDIAGDDYKAQAALLGDLEAQGFGEYAAEQALAILEKDPKNETATALLRRVAEGQLADVQSAFESGQFLLASSLANGFAGRPGNRLFEDLMTRAGDIKTKAELEAQRQAKQVREQARQVVAVGDENLALARRNAEMMRSGELNENVFGLSYKQDAIKFARRAVEAYQTALQIDPSLGPLVGGMDVNSKVRDAQYLYDSLTRPPISPRPRRRNVRN